MNFESLIPNLAGWLGIEPATMLLILGLVVAISNLLGRLIPDDATGFLGAVRKVAKFLGLYLSNRVTAGITVNDVSKVMAGTKQVYESQQLGNAIEDVVDEVQHDSPSIPPVKFRTNSEELPRDEKGRFLKSGAEFQSHWLAAVLIIGMLALSGCATTMTGTAGNLVCSRADSIRLIGQQALLAATMINDPIRREAALGAARTMLAAVDSCPATGAVPADAPIVQGN